MRLLRDSRKKPPTSASGFSFLTRWKRMAGKHSPNRFASSQEVHETVMAQIRRGGFIVSDDLAFTPLRHSILLKGAIHYLGGIYINVRKRLAVLNGPGVLVPTHLCRLATTPTTLC